MARAEITRDDYERCGLRYASDSADAEWSLIVLFLKRSSRVGRPRLHSLRRLWNAIQYIASAGCQWRQLPKDFPPFTTVQHHFYRWRGDGTFILIDEALVQAKRVLDGRNHQPTVGISDSQSVKTTESGGPSGYDAGKEIQGRKRHIVVDTTGNLLDGVVHPADVQDRDGAPDLLRQTSQTALPICAAPYARLSVPHENPYFPVVIEGLPVSARDHIVCGVGLSSLCLERGGR